MAKSCVSLRMAVGLGALFEGFVYRSCYGYHGYRSCVFQRFIRNLINGCLLCVHSKRDGRQDPIQSERIDAYRANFSREKKAGDRF